jgi:arylformamidase
MARLWGSRGVETRLERLPGLNHFTVLDPLANPDSALVRRIAALAHASTAA